MNKIVGYDSANLHDLITQNLQVPLPHRHLPFHVTCVPAKGLGVQEDQSNAAEKKNSNPKDIYPTRLLKLVC